MHGLGMVEQTHKQRDESWEEGHPRERSQWLAFVPAGSSAMTQEATLMMTIGCAQGGGAAAAQAAAPATAMGCLPEGISPALERWTLGVGCWATEAESSLGTLKENVAPGPPHPTAGPHSTEHQEGQSLHPN